MPSGPQRLNGVVFKTVLTVVGVLLVAVATWSVSWGQRNERSLNYHNVSRDAHPKDSARLDMLEEDLHEVENRIAALDDKIDKGLSRQDQHTILLEQIKEAIANGH